MSPPLPPSDDLSNKTLIHAVTLGVVLGGLGLLTVPLLPADLGRPGGPLLQSLAIIGSLMLLGAFGVAFGKRMGGPGKQGVTHHVWLACIGMALVVTHSTGTLTEIPSSLLAMLAFLVVLGVWARLQGAQRMAATFGTKPAGFGIPDPAVKAQLRALIEEKEALLPALDPDAREGTFSPGVRHWLRAPLSTLAYRRAMARESDLVGARAPLSRAQARWRLVHQLLAWGFVGGVLIHVIVVTFFAAYTADGREIYWWHLFAWDLPL